MSGTDSRDCVSESRAVAGHNAPRTALECRSMYRPLGSVLVRHPAQAFISQSRLDATWRRFGYLACPDFLQACREFDLFVRVLEDAGASVEFLNDDADTGPDSIYVHDPAFTLGTGLVIGRMGKALREPETKAFKAFGEHRDWPILGRIESPARLEGGDLIWLDEETLAAGVGYRTNVLGIRALESMSEGVVNEIVRVPLPHFRGPGDVLHLMSLISPIAERVAVVYRPLLPVPFLERLRERGTQLIDVPDEEFETLGCNVLAASPALAIMAGGNPVTRQRIEAAGIQVRTYPPTEISLKGSGGPTCLTRPLVRR